MSGSRPVSFTPRERAPGTHWIGGWMGPRAVLDAVVKRKIPSPRRESNPRTPIVAIPTELSRSRGMPALYITHCSRKTCSTVVVLLAAAHITPWRQVGHLAFVQGVCLSTVAELGCCSSVSRDFPRHVPLGCKTKWGEKMQLRTLRCKRHQFCSEVLGSNPRPYTVTGSLS